MLRRIIALSALLGPIALAAAAPAAGAAVRSSSAPPAPAVTARTAAVAAAWPVLRLGSRGSAVVTLQRRLTTLYYFDVGPADGVFGAAGSPGRSARCTARTTSTAVMPCTA
jgi:peptidoglycan hydrolase-like protein with peptidoglycan-binding domain